jgi:uncharacterized membrane protein YeiH
MPTEKALGYGLNPAMSAPLGMLTGIGGGMLRDTILAQVPTVLRSELYAVAALAGASVVVVGHVRRGWRLPVADLPRRFEAGAGVADGEKNKVGKL